MPSDKIKKEYRIRIAAMIMTRSRVLGNWLHPFAQAE